jgi:hypothetical protein
MAQENILNNGLFKPWPNQRPSLNTFLHHIIYMPWNGQKLKTLIDNWSSFGKGVPFFVFGSAVRNHSIIEERPGIFLNGVYDSELPPETIKGFTTSIHAPLEDTTIAQIVRRSKHEELLEVPEDVLDSLANLIDYCKKRKVSVVLVESPSYVFNHSLGEKRWSQISNLANEKNIPFINLNIYDSLTVQSQFFQNTFDLNQHLTKDGADAFSVALAHEILKIDID